MVLNKLVIISFIILATSGCATPYTQMPELGQNKDSESVLLIARGESYVPSVGSSVGIILREVDGEGLPFLGVGTPATQVLPGKRVLSGTLQTPPNLGTVTTIKTKRFSVKAELEPGWVYFLTLEQSRESLDVKVLKFCKSLDHRRTYLSLVEQKMFYPGVGLSDFEC